MMDIESETTPFLSNIVVEPVYHKKSTEPQTITNSLNLLMGMGLLSIPFAFSKLGWYLSMLLTPTFGLACFTSALLSHRYPKNRFTKALFCFEAVMAGVALIILLTDSIVSLFRLEEYTSLIMGLSFVVLTPMTFLDLNILSRVSFVGVVSVFVLVFTLIWNFFVFRAKVEDTNNLPKSFQDIGLGIGLLFIGFDGHACFPSLLKDMEDPRYFKSSLIKTYTLVTLLYSTFGIIGYSLYANKVLSEVTLNFPKTGFSGLLTNISLVLIIFNPLTKYSLILVPVNSTVEEYFGLHHDLMKQKLSRSIISAIAFAIALWFPKFEEIMGFMGAGTSFMISLLIPIGFYLHDDYAKMKTSTFTGYLCLFIFSFFGMITGIYGVITLK